MLRYGGLRDLKPGRDLGDVHLPRAQPLEDRTPGRVRQRPENLSFHHCGAIISLHLFKTQALALSFPSAEAKIVACASPLLLGSPIFKAKGIQMRKAIFAINTTLDGNCDHTKGNADDELHDYFARLLRDADVLVYGRKTYQLMVPFWPDMAKTQSGQTRAINEFARAFAAVGKIVVFSRSLDESTDKKTRIVRAKPGDEILKLKQEQGKSILIGGVDVASQIMELGLIDEYHFVVQPTLAGAGRRLLEGVSLPESLQLRLVGSEVFGSGCVALRYLKQ